MTTETNIDPILKKLATVNPYLLGADMIRRRLLWDLNPKSWRSRRHLKSIQNTRVGAKTIIICNGPSLLKTDFQSLKEVDTFGLNKINLLFDKTDFRPSRIVAVNDLPLQQNADFFNDTTIPLLLDSSATDYIRSRPNVTFLHSWHGARFAKDCSISIPQGNTVTYVALELAFHMGYSDVALVGCDHYFKSQGPANMRVESGAKDESHFDPNYFAGGAKWDLPDLPASDFYYAMAQRYYAAYGRRIINATVGGHLDIFPRMHLNQWLEE